MNPYSVMIVVFACLYLLSNIGVLIAVSHAVTRGSKFTANANGPFLHTTILFFIAGVVQFFG